MNETTITSPDTDIVTNIIDTYSETQREILAIETRKTRNKLFSIAAILFIFSFIPVLNYGIPSADMIIAILIFPIIFTALGFFANKEPLVALLIGMAIMLAVWVYTAITIHASTLLTGWLPKSIVIYLFLAGLQNAREAHRIRKELKS